MADIQREAALKLAVQTTGGEQVQALAAQFEQLAKQGGDLAPEFAALAAELRQVGQQDQLVAELGKIESTLAATGAELDSARTKAQSLGQSYQEQAVKVETFRNAQLELKNTVVALDASLAESRGNQALLKATTDAAGKATDAYKNTMAALRVEIADQTVALGQEKAALASVTAETNAAQRSLEALGQQYATADNAVSALDASLIAQKEQLASLNTSLEAAGVTTESYAAAQNQVAEALAAVRVSAGVLAVEQDNLTAAQERATAAAAADAAEQERLNFVYQEQKALYGSLFEEVVARADAANKLALSLKEETAAQEKATLAAEQAITGAFGALGVRSLEQIQAEVTRVESSLLLLAEGYEKGTVSAGSFTRATAGAQVQLAALVEETRVLPELPSLFQNITSSVNGLVSEFAGLTATIGVFALATKPVIDLAIQVDSLHRALTTITGSAREADAAMEFLAQTANKSGLSISGISNEFVSFTAAIRTAGFSAADANQIFASVANAAGNLGLSTEKSSSILLALGQIANKGVVSMEELRRQLGEALPGAMSLLAQGLGVTQAQLIKLVETGQLTAQQALIPLANALTQLGSKDKDVEGLSASFARLGNAGREAILEITKSEPFKALGTSIDFITRHFGELTSGLKILGEAFVIGKIGDAISGFARMGEATAVATTAVVANTVAEVENTTVTAANTAQRVAATTAAIAGAEANVALTATTRTITTTGLAAGRAIGALAEAPSLLGRIGSGALALAGGPVGALLLFGLNAKSLGTYIGETAAKWAGYEAMLKKAEATQKDAADLAGLNQKAQQQLAATIVRGTVAYNEHQVALAQQIISSGKLVEARKLEGDALIEIARLSGSEAEQRQAAVVAATNNEGAVQSLVVARRTEVDLLEKHIAQVTADATASGTLDAALKKQLETQSRTLDTQKAELSQAEAHLASLHAQTLASQTASQAYQDNSGRLEELKGAYEATAAAAALNKQANVDGLVSLDAVVRSAQAAAVAENLYRDAINDQVTAAQRQVAGAALYSNTVGQTTQSTQIAAAAAANYSDKVGLLTTALSDQVAALKESAVQVAAEIAAHGDPTGARAKELTEIQNLIGLKTEDAEKSKQSSQAAKDAAAQTKLVAQAYKDNSANLGEYRAKMNEANIELAKQIDLQKQGKASSDDVAQALRNAATAQALYKDAVGDTVKNLQAQQTLDASRNNQMSANIKLAQAQASAMEASARASGDEAGATRAQISGKQGEIAARQQSAAAMRQEADSQIAIARQQMAEEQQLGTLTPAKEKEYQARINNANATKTEAEATEAAIPGIQSEIAALEGVTAAANQAAAAKKASSGLGAGEAAVLGADGKPIPGFVQKTVMGQDTDAITNLRQRRELGLLGSGDKAAAEAAYQAATASLASISAPGYSAFVSQKALQDEAGRVKDAKAILDQINSIIKGEATPTPGAVSPAAPAAAKAAAVTPTTHTVNISMGGLTTSLGMATAADASNLTGLLTQLVAASNRTTG